MRTWAFKVEPQMICWLQRARVTSNIKQYLGQKLAGRGSGYHGQDRDILRSELNSLLGLLKTLFLGEHLQSIALLRLDTDWFQSITHELVNPLAPSRGGILIIDDYGDWAGAKNAVDKYFANRGLWPLLHRIDTSTRLIIKQRLQV
jgi:hypothetical protein